MKDKKKVLLVLDSLFYSRLPTAIIHTLKQNTRLELVILLLDWNRPEYVKEHFSDCLVHYGMDPHTIEQISPNLLICCQIWWKEMPVLLSEAIRFNIPVLMYDHGSLLTTCEYRLQKDERIAIYRSDITQCSHIACWGNRPRDCWLTYGIPAGKLFITGAIQYDCLYDKEYRPKESKEALFQRLGIAQDARVILFFIHYYHTYIDKEQRNRIMSTLKVLEKYVSSHPNLVLILKPHPLSMAVTNTPFPHAAQTMLVANPIEPCWPGMPRANPDDLTAAASVVITTISSMIISPLTLKKPIIHLELDTKASQEFSQYGRKVFFNLKKGMSVSRLLDKIEKCNYKSPDMKEHDHLTAELNDGHRHKALSRFGDLIDHILDEQEKGKVFYPLTREEEFLQSKNAFPELPYAYNHLFNLYLDDHDFDKVEEILYLYESRFKDSLELIVKPIFYQLQRGRAIAYRLAETLILKKTRTPRELFFIAKIMYELRRFSESLKWCKALLRRKKIPIRYEIAAWRYLGVIYGQDNPQKKADYLSRAVARLPRLTRHLTDIEVYNTASFLKSNGLYKKARHWFKKLEQTTPLANFRAGAFFHLGEMAQIQKQYKRAEHFYLQAMVLNRDQRHRKAQENLIEIYIEEKEYAKARALIENHLKLFRDPLGLFGTLKLARTPENVAIIQDLLALIIPWEYKTSPVLFFIAEQLFLAQRFDESVPWLEKITADGSLPLRYRVTAWFYLGEIAGAKDPVRKLACVSQAMAALPQDKVLLKDIEIYNIASILQKYGHYAKAWAWFLELEAITPKYNLRAGALFHLAEMDFADDRWSAAREKLVETLKIMPDHQEAQKMCARIDARGSEKSQNKSIIGV